MIVAMPRDATADLTDPRTRSEWLRHLQASTLRRNKKLGPEGLRQAANKARETRRRRPTKDREK